jgi:transcriptional antiterminator NusG
VTETSAETPTPESYAATGNKRWYVVHAYSGMEKAVERNLRERIDRSEMKEKFGRILVPMEEVVELKNGKKSVSERRFFPGYVLVEMEMGDDSWHLVKHTSKVTGFVGGAKTRPSPISEAEVMKIVSQMQEGVEKPRPKVQWEVGEMVRIKEGRSPTSTARSKTSTTTSRRSAWRSPSSDGPPRSSSISRRSRRSDFSGGRRMPPGVFRFRASRATERGAAQVRPARRMNSKKD